MKALVTAASRHGSTREIAQWIAEALEEQGIDADVRDPREVADLTDYEVVIAGSAIYVGQWLGDARDFVERFAQELQARKVWLFSSGLADAPAKDANGTPSLKSRMERTQAVAHRHFPGKLDVLQLSLAERAAIMAARGKYGDSRDAQSVKDWARGIGEILNAATASA